MSFDSGSIMVVERGAKECKPDYEKEAAALKKEIEDIQFTKDAVLSFSTGSMGYRFKNISSMAELIGGLAIIEKERKDIYDDTLKRLEKE